MKKLLVFTGLLSSVLFTSIESKAQKTSPHATSIGVRLTPDGGGFALKTFLSPNLAFEGQLNAGGIFAFEGESFNTVGLLEYHLNLPAPNWRIYFGGGGHVGVWQHGRRWERNRWEKNSDVIVGLDAVGGVEYNFRKIPLVLAGDFKPAINIAPDIDFFAHNCIGASARFYIGR